MVVNCLVYIRIVVFMHMFSISLDILFAKINGSPVDKHTLKHYLYEFDTQNNCIYHEYDIWSRPPNPYDLDCKKTESCQLRNVFRAICYDQLVLTSLPVLHCIRPKSQYVKQNNEKLCYPMHRMFSGFFVMTAIGYMIYEILTDEEKQHCCHIQLIHYIYKV